MAAIADLGAVRRGCCRATVVEPMHSTLALSQVPCSPSWQRGLRWLAMVLLLSWASGCASLPANTNRTASKAFADPGSTPLGQLVQARRAQAGTRSDSAFYLLDGVDAALASRLALIDGARRSMDLQYYAIHADASTEVLLQRLREAARRGVRVRILLDDFNTVGEDTQVLRLAFEPNVEVRLFNPVPGTRNTMLGRVVTSLHDVERLQKRMHNKMFIADNAWGITGGRNLGDQYFGIGDKQNFVDLDVLAAGRIVRDMSTSFDRFWNDELAYPVQSLLDKEDLDLLRRSAPQSSSAQGMPAVQPAKPAMPVMPVTASPTVLPSVIPSEVVQADRPPIDLRAIPLVWAPSTLMVDEPGKVGPGDDEANAGETVIDGLMNLMQAARTEVLIISPYFVPGPRMMSVYEQLRKRGVRVRLLTNSLASNDAPLAHAGYARYRKALLDIGVEIHELRSDPETAGALIGSDGGRSDKRGSWFGGAGGSKGNSSSRASLHSKAIVIDRYLSVIGSMNLDMRSQLKNSEAGLVIRSTALAQQVSRQVEQTIDTTTYRLDQRGDRLVWRAPPGVSFKDEDSEPGASAKLKLFVRVLGPLAPEEML
ncbi:phospholipase D family protein [Ramlibacter sp. PS3R-8]|uniref:phospholipase D family protein n=1 Tax=Ramlibacter sp. PS3R-8 TaxID=3133437 RepID=UPI0030AE9583